MRHKPPQLIIFFLILALYYCLFINAVAGENDEEIPNLEFLIFLGAFEDDIGNWQDPMEIEKMIDAKKQSDLNDKEISEESGDE